MKSDATDALEKAVRDYRRALETVDKRRSALAEAIVDAMEEDVRQVDIARITGYTREHVRRTAREALDRRIGSSSLDPF
jgi:outer membrane protein TolC